MGRQAGRTPQDTRRLILDAGAEAIRTYGASTTLDHVADQAGISRGGVLYHFKTKDALFTALITDAMATFRAAVEAAIEPDDQAPGRLTRAYIRAAFGPDDDHDLRDHAPTLGQLMTLPEAQQIAIDDARRWADDLEADGLPAAVLDLVVAAADGAALARFWAHLTAPGRRDRLRDQLLALTRRPSLD